MYLKPRAISWPGGSTYLLPYLSRAVTGDDQIDHWYRHVTQIGGTRWNGKVDVVDVNNADEARQAYKDWVRDQRAVGI
jgi:hypothetical protein